MNPSTSPHQSKRQLTFASSNILSSNNPFEQVVQSIISYASAAAKSHHNPNPNPTTNNQHSTPPTNLLQKYSQEYFLNYFDHNVINETLQRLNNQNQKQLKLIDFIRTFLNIIKHTQDETLYLTMSLRRLFLKIKQENQNQTGIKFSDFTNYLCDRISKDDHNIIAPLRKVAREKHNPDVNKVRDIDLYAPIIQKHADIQQPKIARDKKKIDKKLVQKKPVSRFIYDAERDQIITMGRLSSYIHFYDMNLKKIRTIQPKSYKDMIKQIAILSIAYSPSAQRIGAIINGVGIAFWEASDNYQTQKTISKYQGDKIYYLKLFNEWVTVDKTTVYFWNIKEETVCRKIEYSQAALINDICTVGHLRCLCVSYTAKDDKKSLMVYKSPFETSKPIASYDLGHSGCHTLHYNTASQMVILAGYHNQLEVFEVEKSHSINLKKQLRGHNSIVTCIGDIQLKDTTNGNGSGSNYIMSGDDSGEVRIWELDTMKCVQVVKVAKYIGQIHCNVKNLIFSDTRINIMEMDKFDIGQQSSSLELEVLFGYHNQVTQHQLIITRKDIRQMNLKTGQIEKIVMVCDSGQEVTSSVRISSGLLVGTSKGNIKQFSDDDLKKKWSVFGHQGQVIQIRYDRNTRFIFTLGGSNSNGKLLVWPEKTILTEGPKKSITFKSRNFNFLEIFSQLKLAILGSTDDREINIWDYENVKLLAVIGMDWGVMTMHLNFNQKILATSSSNGQISLIKLTWSGSQVGYQLLYVGNSDFSGVRKRKKVAKFAVQPIKPRDDCELTNQQGCLQTSPPLKEQSTSSSSSSTKQINNLQKNKINNDEIIDYCSKTFITSSTDKNSTKLNNSNKHSTTTTKVKAQAQAQQNLPPSISNINKTQSPSSITNLTKYQQQQQQDQSNIKIQQQQDKNDKQLSFCCEPIPSIKLICNAGSVDDENKLLKTIKTIKTLKTINKIHSQETITTHILMRQIDGKEYIFLANAKGVISCFCIDRLIREHGIIQSGEKWKKKESPHMYRPAKEDYDQELSKGSTIVTHIDKLSMISKVKKSYFEFIWKVQTPKKQAISALTFIDMKTIYIYAAFSSGSNRILNYKTGAIQGNFKISQPLPILWNLKVDKHAYVRNNFYQTLLVLDQILTNHGFQMMAKQYKSINITNFLQKMNNHNMDQLPPSVPQKKPNLLRDQYIPEDFVKQIEKQNTLKSLEAFKRVKQIHQKMQQADRPAKDMDEQNMVKMNQTLMRRKQDITNYLSENYFPKLIEQGSSSKMVRSLDCYSLQHRTAQLIKKVQEKKRIYKGQYIPKRGIQCVKNKNNKSSSPSTDLPTISSLSSQQSSNNKNRSIIRQSPATTTASSPGQMLLKKLTQQINQNNGSSKKLSNNNKSGSFSQIGYKEQVSPHGSPQVLQQNSSNVMLKSLNFLNSNDSGIKESKMQITLNKAISKSVICPSSIKRTHNKQQQENYSLDNKTASQILKDLNQKLKSCKKKYVVKRGIF